MSKTEELFGEWEEELQGVCEFLEFKPDTAEPKLYLPSKLGLLSKIRRLIVCWYHEGDNEKPMRFAYKQEFHDRSPPNRLRVRRWLAIVIGASFVPWGKWLFHLQDIFVNDPDQEDFREALIPWTVQPIRERVLRLERTSIDFTEEVEDALEDLEHIEGELLKLQDWAERLGLAIAHTHVQRERAVARLRESVPQGT